MIKYVIRRKTDGALYCRTSYYGYFSTDTNKPIKFYTKIGYAKLGLSHLNGSNKVDYEIIPYYLFDNTKNNINKNKNDEYFMNVCKDFYYALRIKCNKINLLNMGIERLVNKFGEDEYNINPEFKRLLEELYNKFEK